MLRAGGAFMGPSQAVTAQDTTTQWDPWRAGIPPHSSHPVMSASNRSALAVHHSKQGCEILALMP